MERIRLQNSTGRRRPRSSKSLPRDSRPYRGVTFYKRTGRWEANLWYEKRQYSLGAFYTALEAARGYDMGILCTRSSSAELNFSPTDYSNYMQTMHGFKSFLECQQYIRDLSRQANCHIVNDLYKGVLIDLNGRWEVKYRVANQQSPPKFSYVLVGRYATEETALRAYNETALTYAGPSAIITSFQTRQLAAGITRSLPYITSTARDDEPRYRMVIEMVSNLAEDNLPVLSDDHSDASTGIAPNVPTTSQEQLLGLAAKTPAVAVVRREEIHTDSGNSGLVALGEEPVGCESETHKDAILIHERPVPDVEEPYASNLFASVLLLGIEGEGLSANCDHQDVMSLDDSVALEVEPVGTECICEIQEYDFLQILESRPVPHAEKPSSPGFLVQSLGMEGEWLLHSWEHQPEDVMQCDGLAGTGAQLYPEETHTDSGNNCLVALEVEPVGCESEIQEYDFLQTLESRSVPYAEDPSVASLCFSMEVLAMDTEGGGLSCNCDHQDVMQFNERCGEYQTDTSSYWMLPKYHDQGHGEEKNAGPGAVQESQQLIHVHSFFQYFPHPLNGVPDEVMTPTAEIDLNHLKSMPPFHFDLSL